MFRRLVLVLSSVIGFGCAAKVDSGEITLEHPSVSDSLPKSTVAFAREFVSLTELTNEKICVEYIDQSSVYGEEERQEELARSSAQFAADGGPPHAGKLTNAAPHEGAQYCVDNDFVQPESSTLEVSIDLGNRIRKVAFRLQGGKARDGAWGARGATRFPNADEKGQKAAASAKAATQGYARMREVVAALAAARYRCSKLPPKGEFLKVDCDIGEGGSVEVWSTDPGTSGIEFVSRWGLKFSYKGRCGRIARQFKDMNGALHLDGVLECHLDGLAKFKERHPFTKGERWAELLARHVKTGERVAEQLDRRHLID